MSIDEQNRRREETKERVATAVERLRIDAGMSQTRLADEMRLVGEPWHQTTVSRVETGYREISVVEMMSLTQVLDCTVEDLLPSADSDSDPIERHDWEVTIGIFNVSVKERDRILERIHDAMNGIDAVSTVAPMEES